MTMQNDEDEFADRWAAIQAKLTRDEQDLVATVLSGAEVNHALLYCVVFAIVGMLIGALGVHLFV